MTCAHCKSWAHQTWECPTIKIPTTEFKVPSPTGSSSQNDENDNLRTAGGLALAGLTIAGMIAITATAVVILHQGVKKVFDIMDGERPENSAKAAGVLIATFAAAAGGFAYTSWEKHAYPAIYLVEGDKSRSRLDDHVFYGSKPSTEDAAAEARGRCYSSIPLMSRFSQTCETLVSIPAGKKGCIIYGLGEAGRPYWQVTRLERHLTLQEMCARLNLTGTYCVSGNVYQACNYTP